MPNTILSTSHPSAKWSLFVPIMCGYIDFHFVNEETEGYLGNEETCSRSQPERLKGWCWIRGVSDAWNLFFIAPMLRIGYLLPSHKGVQDRRHRINIVWGHWEIWLFEERPWALLGASWSTWSRSGSLHRFAVYYLERLSRFYFWGVENSTW